MTIYDRISPIYDWLTLSERPYRDLALEMLALESGETALEVGCGTGQALLQLAAHTGENGRLIGLDLSQGMLHQAQQNLAQSPDTAVIFLRGSGLQIPLAANSCDAAFLSFTLELFDIEEQHRLLAELRRVLKEDGRLALVTLSTHRQTLPLDVYISLHEAFPAVIDCRPLDPAPLLAAAGFIVTKQKNQAMFGLPLSVLTANIQRSTTNNQNISEL